MDTFHFQNSTLLSITVLGALLASKEIKEALSPAGKGGLTV
jgi:hypothetical protein